ncbi:HEAT repeat domain-containing protein [Chitinophaga tropicalis]|uniref:WGR domain-containing protein n=1 Tax=Chitinophaga tropicalis TaxID=2683588 RepID=A0A7K1U9Y1_9BACT|nr:HEAT repeat domain-containing protein [Chitinophaga tropicalis]MVT11177.1 WGR domain-containing protein [Chitinophaga tropicalis]
MRFVKQTRLFYREGNSDKTYEIDLCEVGPGQYVVNFRYGKRGSALKEGSKTVAPVSLAEATAIFDALEKEKRSKGYSGEEDAGPVAEFVAPDASGVEGAAQQAILKRLEYALKRNSKFKTSWKTSRVIWMAGELRLKEAVPYITKLIEREDAMQRYASLWALGRCGDNTAVPVLHAYANNQAYPYYQRQIASNSMLLLMTPEEADVYLEQYRKILPLPFQEAINKDNRQELLQLLRDQVGTLISPSYPVLEELYIIAYRVPVVKQVLVEFLSTLPFKPNYFQHIRHIFKQAELRDDHEMFGILGARFEREPEMFRHKNWTAYEGYSPEIYVEALQSYISTAKELKKPGSRIAYSNKTRHYLRNRVLRRLRKLGEAEDIQYVRLATALLLQYDAALNNVPERYARTMRYDYSTRSYTTLEKYYPANAEAVYLHYILSGNRKDYQLINGGMGWYIKQDTTQEQTNQALKKEDGLLNKLASLLRGGKKDDSQPKESAEKTTNDSPAPFAHLWRKLPQAFIQLLAKARMEEIHVFALTELTSHPDYTALRQKMDVSLITALLRNPFPIPQRYGLELAKEKYDPNTPSISLVLALIGSPWEEARSVGMDWMTGRPDVYFASADFVKDLIFSPYKDIRAFAGKQLEKTPITGDNARLIVGKAIAHLLSFRNADKTTNDFLTDGCSLLEWSFGPTLSSLDFPLIEELLNNQLPAAQAFAARLLLLKKKQFNLNHIPDSLLLRLLENTYQPVRDAGTAVLSAIGDEELSKRQGLLLYCCTTSYTDLRNGIRPVLKRLATAYPRLAVTLVNELVPLLMRKETSEMLHEDIAGILSNELVEHLHDIDQASALRLLYSNYRPAQRFGVIILEKYIPADQLTLKQVIATGNHELLAVREWCWRFFEQYVARIRYERDDAIALLDATWDDTRAFAMKFFREQFQENDWSPETLVAIADSVRPEVQAFGRELLTRFFRQEEGPSYLMKLSQHPGVAMQLFATNYLEQYATGNLPYLKELEHYFRSVLSRVNKARIAKERIFSFLEKEALQSAEAAAYIGGIIADISATVSIGDKARCITIMRNIHQRYEGMFLPVRFMEIPVKRS